MKKFDYTRLLFLIVSLIILLTGFIIPKSNIIISITCTILIVSLVIFDIKATQITKLSDNNPKVKTIKKLNRLTIFIVIIAYGFTLLPPLKKFLRY